MIPSVSLFPHSFVSGVRVDVIDMNAEGVANASLNMNSDGTQVANVDGSPVDSNVWLVSGLVSDYEVKVTKTGDSVTGTLGSWLPLSSNRTWSIAAAYGFVKSAVLTVEIREAVSPFTVLDTATVTLSATNL